MSESKCKTMRHIETVRNYLNTCIRELMNRAEQHDQTKLEDPEVDYFEKYTPLLRGITYGSEKYREIMGEMRPAIEHHNQNNRHHPEHFKSYDECNGCFKRFDEFPDSCDVCGYSQYTVRYDLAEMNLIDQLEMICDWLSASLRHDDGDITRSISINQKRFGYSDDQAKIFRQTAKFLLNSGTFHKANES